MTLTSVCRRLATLSVSRPRTTVLIGALLALVAVAFAAKGLRLETSNLDLIDGELEPVRAFRDFADEFGTTNLLVVVLEGEDESALATAARRLGPLLRRSPGVRAVLDRLELDAETLDSLGVDEFLMSYDHELFFLFVQPDEPHASLDKLAPFVEGVQATLATADLDSLGVRAGLTGLPQYAVDDRDAVRRDITVLSGLAAFLVATLFVLGFRTAKRPLLALLTLLIATGWTVGVVTLVPGHLTLLSAFFASILFGLGIDFGIHVVARVEELRRDGAATGVTEKEAVVTAVSALAPALTTSAATTAAVFFSMLASGFRGFEELGLIAGAGVLLCLIATIVLLPALLALGSQRGESPTRVSVGARTTPSRSSRLGNVLVRLCRPAVASVIVGLALLGALSEGPGFDSDYLNLQPRDSETVRLERSMVERSDLSPQFAAFVTDDRDEAEELTDRLLDEETVGEVHSIVDLDELVDDDGEPLPVAESYRRSLESAAGRYAVYAYPEGDVWEPTIRDRFLERMQAIDADVTGMPVLGRFMVERTHRALRITAGLGSIVLLLFVFADLRRPALVLLATAPTFLTVGALHGLLRLIGVSWNPIDIMALPIVLGIAVDDGVHLVHRFLEERGDLRRTLAGAGRSVVLTSLTTVAAFGSLALASHRGLRSFAIVTSLGVSTALVLSTLVLPMLLLAYKRLRPAVLDAVPKPEQTVLPRLS